MTKQEPAQKIADGTGLGQGQAREVVDATFQAIAEELAGGNEVSISGFGKFSVSERGAREGRNPATGETIQIAASKGARFSAASGLKKQLNQ